MSRRYLLLPLLTVLAAFLAACSRPPQEEQQSEKRAGLVQVSVLTLRDIEMPEVYLAPGTIRATTTSTLSSKVLAYVESVDAHEGERVRAGQILIRLNGQELDAGLHGAQAVRDESTRAIDEADSAVTEARLQLDLTAKTFSRLKDLYDKRSLSNQEFDEANTRLQSAQSAYERAQARQQQAKNRAEQSDAEFQSAQIKWAYASIAAPFSGLIVTRNVEAGVLASPGMPLLTMEKEDSYRLEASVEASRASAIHLREEVPVQIDGVPKTVPAKVTEISPLVDAGSRTYTVKLALPSNSSGIHSGMFARALFPAGTQKSLLIPCDAVVQHGDLAAVLVAEDGFVRRKLVTTGIQSGDRLSVLSGLHSGDDLIYPLPEGLQEGTAIEVRPR